MGTPLSAALASLCIVTACGSQDEPEACDYMQESSRCKGNEYQHCLPGGCFFGPCVGSSWGTVTTCTSPQVCKIGTQPGIFYALQEGCFDPDSSCATEGTTTCALSAFGNLPVDLWTCVRRSADQSLQWTVTKCDQQTPSAICLPHSWWTGLAPPTACYEYTGTCPPSSLYASRCEGNVVYFCSGPTVVDGKAVMDWVPNIDCAAVNMVCRDGGCVNP